MIGDLKMFPWKLQPNLNSQKHRLNIVLEKGLLLPNKGKLEPFVVAYGWRFSRPPMRLQEQLVVKQEQVC